VGSAPDTCAALKQRPKPCKGRQAVERARRFQADESARLATIVCIAALLFLALAHFEDSASRAAWGESHGAFDGSFLDAHGRILAGPNTSASNDRLLDTVHLVGYEGPQGQKTGLMRLFSSQLTARHARSDWRTFFLHLMGRPARGQDVVLTVDRQLQRVAAATVSQTRGAAIAVDPQTGHILAMASSPSCLRDSLRRETVLRRCRSDRTHPLSNRVLDQLQAPGSIFKIVTLSAALDTGRFTLNSTFSGVDAFGPSPYFDNSEYPSNVTRNDLTVLTLPQALAFSDNFAFAHIGLTLGAGTMLDYARRFGIDGSIPFDLPLQPSTIAAGKSTLSNSQLAQMAFGAPVGQVTPMQMAMIAATIANHGIMMRPRIVLGLGGPGMHTGPSLSPTVYKRVLSSRAAADITSAMTFVVDHGSGYRAQIAGVRVAGKTGTAASGANKPNAWFICFAPTDHPVVAVAVLHEFSGEGFKYAAPLARRLLVAALQSRGYRVK